MSTFFYENSKPGDAPTKEEVAKFLEEAKKADEFVKEWDLDDYSQYLADLYLFVGTYLNMSPAEFEETSIDLLYFWRDRIMQSLEENLDDDNKKTLPLNWHHWALILTMKKVFGGSKKK